MLFLCVWLGLLFLEEAMAYFYPHSLSKMVTIQGIYLQYLGAILFFLPILYLGGCLFQARITVKGRQLVMPPIAIASSTFVVGILDWLLASIPQSTASRGKLR